MQHFSIKFSEEGYAVHYEEVVVLSGLTRIEAKEAAKLLEERFVLTEGNNLTRH